MKKQRISPIPTPALDASKFETSLGTLPSTETVEKTVSALTKPTMSSKPKGSAAPAVQEKIIPKRSAGRPVKENAVGRSVYNTMVKKSLIKDIKRIAVEEDATVADLIEEALTMFITDRKKKK